MKRQSWVQPAYGPALLHFEDLGVVLWGFPNDPKLPGIQRVAPPAAMLEIARRIPALAALEPRACDGLIVKYVPGKRLVMKHRLERADGKRLLCVRNEEKARLTVLDRDGKNEKTLAKDMLNQGEGFDSTRFLPVWASNDTILFWKDRVVVGPGGKAVTTLSVKLDGAPPVNVQLKLDALAEKAK